MPGRALGDPKSLLKRKGYPKGVRLVDTSSSPIFLHLGPGFCTPPGWMLLSLGFRERLSALSGLAWDHPTRAPAPLASCDSFLH